MCVCSVQCHFFSKNLQSVISNFDVRDPLLCLILNLNAHIRPQSIGNYVLLPMRSLA